MGDFVEKSVARVNECFALRQIYIYIPSKPPEDRLVDRSEAAVLPPGHRQVVLESQSLLFSLDEMGSAHLMVRLQLFAILLNIFQTT